MDGIGVMGAIFAAERLRRHPVFRQLQDVIFEARIEQHIGFVEEQDIDFGAGDAESFGAAIAAFCAAAHFA